MLRKFLAIWIICCMTLSLPADVLAEELTAEAEVASVVQASEDAKPTETPAPTEAAATETPAPTEAAATETPVPTEAAATETPVPTEAAATETPAPTEAAATETPVPTEAAATETPVPTEAAIDTTKDASHSPAFEVGYAEVLEAEAEVQPEDGERFLLPEGLIVYVTDRKEQEDLLEVWLDAQDGPLSGWTEAKYLRPMSEEETAAFIEEACKREEVRFMDAGETLPLALAEEIVFPDAEPTQSPAEGGEGDSPAPTDAPSDEGGEGDSPAPTEEPTIAILLNTEKLSVCAGDFFALAPEFSDGNAHEYAIFISDESILRPEADGRFAALTAGIAELTFSSAYGTTACTVEVLAAPVELSIRVSDGSMGVGETADVQLDGILADRLSITYFSSDESVATVDSDGCVTAIAPGECIITAEAYNGASGSAAIRVYAAPTKLTLSADSAVVRADKTFALAAQVDSGSADDIIWTSSDEGIAIYKAGKIVCTGVGECEIRATLYNGLSAACAVTVKAVPESVKLPYSTLKIGVDESIRLQPDVGDSMAEFRYASSKKKYATVSANGTVKGVRVGTSVVRVRTDNGKETSVTVKVYKAPSKVTASPTTMVLGVGETGKISYSLPKNTAGSVAFASGNVGIATVNPTTGMVTAVAPGKVKIRVRTYNKKNAYVTVEVKNAPESVSLSPTSLSIGVGQILTMSASVNSGAAGKITLSSADKSRLIVSGMRIKGVYEGPVEVVATSYNGAEARASVTVMPAPTKVTLPYRTLTIGVGEKLQLAPDCGGTVGGYTYKSKSTRYVKVSKDGVISGVRAGTSKVTVRTYNGKEATVTVKVCKAPSKVTVSPTTMVLGVGETARISYKLPKNTAGKVTFASADTGIATVDPATGVVTAVAPGKVKLRARTYNKKNTYVTVEVRNAPEAVSISPEALTIGVGQILTMSASVNSGAAGKITLSSTDKSRLIVSGMRIKGVCEGPVEVVATSYNGVEARASVTVVPAPTKVTLPYRTLTIGVGEKLQLEPSAGEGVTGFTYKSKSTRYVKVNASGVIKGVRKGTTKVYVKTYNGKETYVTVKVCAAPSGVKASVSKLELGVGQTGRIGCKLPSGTAGAVTYSSASPEIALVNAKTGEVTALAPGDAVITLKTFNGKKATCTVRVHNAPDAVSVNAQSLEMGVGQTFQLQPVIPEGSFTAITYSTSDPTIAKVSSGGKITATGRGAATIRVQTHVPEVYAEVLLDVGDAPESVSVGESEMKLILGESYRIEPVIPEGSFSPFTFVSSKPDVASVAADGTITTLDVGKTVITVSTFNGKKATIDLKVWHPDYPEKITLLNAPDVVNLSDGSYAMEIAVEPETAAGNIRWTSSNPGAASVNESGVIQLNDYGYAVISAVSTKNSAVYAKFTLTIQTKNLALTIPKRTTKEDGIEANLALIQDIRASAIAQVDALEDGGVISASDASKRRSIIRNIFADYAFAWKTPAYQKYWKAANSENGAKDFKTDRVYYGLPYVSGSNGNNRYNAQKALSEKRYTSSGKGYYLLNRSKLRNGSYVGNDCSALVNAAIWGVKSSHMYDTTEVIAKSSAYKTIKSTAKMRPGDLLCLSKRHVVMFLYYANPEKTKIMIIENGGEEAGTNTVHCAVHNLSYYTNLGYKVRRLSSLG